ncbi:MAG TPA: hypothetical protein VHZ07_10820 [Bryobacteraceae bacterium]|jgi:hypothetical protein|nr:hypothetical protein [Bryobacteraceae bacterium]
MHKISGLFRAVALVALTTAPQLSFAVETHVWEQSDQADFIRGTPKHLSIRSDGHIMLSPLFKELDSTGIPYLWAIAQDSKGDLFYGGGAPTGANTKVFELPANAKKSKVLAELTGLEVHALAVDSHDRVYAAVMPDAKIYRIDAGKPTLFFDPKCKYIWAMQFDKAGNLFVATGDSGIVFKVTPDGHGKEFFRTEETHARSMTMDADGDLIVGTEPGGLVFRVTPAGQSFVLYQTSKREVTSVAVHDGVIYAAAVGSRPTGSVSLSGPIPVLPPATPAPSAVGGTSIRITATPTAPPAIGSLSASVSGGSEVYRIQKNGFAEPIWSSSTDLVYAIAFDNEGRPLLGTGNRGLIYRVDSDVLSTQLLNAPPTQVTGFLQGRNGDVYAVTGNVGNLYSIGPSLETRGTFESDVLDAGGEFAYWGKVHLTAQIHNGNIEVETRSGNVNRPQENWSPWTKVNITPVGGQINSPAARFLQYRLTIDSNGSESPDLSIVDLAYLPKNVAPRVLELEMAPYNYKEQANSLTLERNIMPSGSPSSLTLPAMGHRKAPTTPNIEAAAGSATLQYSKGSLTARWAASDENGDPLIFKVEIRSKGSSTWRLLKDKLQDHFYSFDTNAFPDGDYVLRVSASDAPDNTPGKALTGSMMSDAFTIDNTPPEIVDISENGGTVRFTAKDTLSWIAKAEYAVDGGDWTLLEPVNKVTDSQTLQFQLPTKSGELLAVRVFDENDNVVVKQFTGQ